MRVTRMGLIVSILAAVAACADAEGARPCFLVTGSGGSATSDSVIPGDGQRCETTLEMTFLADSVGTDTTYRGSLGMRAASDDTDALWCYLVRKAGGVTIKTESLTPDASEHCVTRLLRMAGDSVGTDTTTFVSFQSLPRDSIPQ